MWPALVLNFTVLTTPGRSGNIGWVESPPPQDWSTHLDQGPRRRPFMPQRQDQRGQAKPRPWGIRPPGNLRQAVASAATTMIGTPLWRRMPSVAAIPLRRRTSTSTLNTYFRVMREQG